MDELAATITILEKAYMENSTIPAGIYRSVTSAGSEQSRRVPAVVGMSPAVQMLGLLNTVYMPMVIYLGLVGNILSLIAFLFTHLKSRTSSLYMGSLAISDSGFLFVLSFAWLNERGVHVYQQGACQLLVFLSSAFSCWSVWLTVSFTAERFVAVRYPLWRPQLSSTRMRPKMAIAGTALFSFTFNAPLLVFVDVHKVSGGYTECSLNPDYEEALYYMNIMDTVLTLIVPVLLITVMNAIIARVIYLIYSRYRLQSDSCRMTPIFRDPLETSPSKQIGTQVVCNGGVTTVSGGCVANATQVSVTGMLLLVSTVFLLLNLPSYIMRIYVFFLSHHDAEAHSTPSPESLPYVLQRYFMLLYYTNFAINFVLYNAGSKLFRRTLWGHLRRQWLALCDSVAELRSNLRHPLSSQCEDVT